ncbi:type II toxin-antitoxin system RelE/ParE family toxin [Xenorhabdus bovienii]|uniref:type II toxin-antitoxin system RelE/ParE family toxin n=1 Tax=Xenorhabdus bovienii TaxID=40576 RepID=UPI0023B30615|nr:type II toxin-antitoxin system RelE/ParE family toxin [Xenorhabdus bovienii]MDE9432588.1 type II toxin-antitoxin system RelE/ParE family toxin [Xenorhabdus bovienii]MDE9490364.1 type II toxin-antitoxin system RelE/ParE family toxin [Xenorhabdus bovienii]MDE9506640.1 type II toxin-antitoxin system RelE/ParE family toxin [Xenorhabdus bovienii]
MNWNVELYGGVDDEILNMPPKIQARLLKLLELIEEHGANLGEPHTKAMGKGLFEIRAKAQEGIERGLFCYLQGSNIIVLHVFVKKSQKTPKKDLELAYERMREVTK